MDPAIIGLVIPIVALVAIFTFVSIASWSEERRKEREALYRSEVLKKLSDNLGANAQPVLDFIREEEQNALRKRREGLKLGGLVTLAVGIGVTALLRGIVRDEPVWLVGLIPGLIGLALLLYVLLMAPKPEPPRRG